MYFERTFEMIFRTKEDFIICMDLALNSKTSLNKVYDICDGYEIKEDTLILSKKSNNSKVIKLPFEFKKNR